MRSSLITDRCFSLAYRTVGDIVPTLTSKCLSGRPKIKERAFDILLMYIEIDKNAEIEEELVKGLENKQPKIVQACLELLRKGLSYVPFLHSQLIDCLLFFCDAESSAPKFFPSNHSFPKLFPYLKIGIKLFVMRQNFC
jgi:hypothetical protein